MSYVRICRTEKSREGGLLFWKHEGKGYTADPNQAGIFDDEFTNQDTLSVNYAKFADLPVSRYIEFHHINRFHSNQKESEND